jgi:hypothetical protein
LWRAQRGVCALCRRPLGDRFDVDHDHRLAAAHGHASGVGCPRCVRGLLCAGWSGCNRFLSTFRGEPEFLRRAADYSERRRTA